MHIEKSLPSAFPESNLEDWLRARQIDTVTVAGYTINNCVDSTIKHAFHAGFAIELLCDATGTFSYANAAGVASAEEIHRAFCVVVHSRFGAVVTTQTWIDAVGAGLPLQHDTPIASNRRALKLLHEAPHDGRSPHRPNATEILMQREDSQP